MSFQSLPPPLEDKVETDDILATSIETMDSNISHCPSFKEHWNDEYSPFIAT